MAWSLSDKELESIQPDLKRRGLSASIVENRVDFTSLRTLLWAKEGNDWWDKYREERKKAVAHFVKRFQLTGEFNPDSTSAIDALLKALSRAHQLSNPERVLAYWTYAAGYQNLSAMSEFTRLQGHLDIDALPDRSPTIPESLESDDEQSSGKTSHWLLFGSGRASSGNGSFNVLLAVPLAKGEHGDFIPPRDGALPRMNRDWLEPGNPSAPKDVYLGELSDLDDYLGRAPRDGFDSWKDYWAFVEGLVLHVAGCSLSKIHFVIAAGRDGLVVRVVKDETNKNAKSFASALTYGAQSDGLLKRIAQGDARHIPVMEHQGDLLETRLRHSGHIDTHSPGRERKGFALERSQRLAVNHMLLVPDHQLLAVNGPPGTGKTSFLRSVIASEWVNAACLGNEGVLMLATAATNKAVTNIIESFAEISGEEMQPEWSSRWIAGLPSYGWFFPAKSHASDRWNGYMALRTSNQGNDGEHLIAAGLTERFFERAASGRDVMKADYLALHAKACGYPHPLPSPLEASRDIQKRLKQSIQTMQAIQRQMMNLVEARRTLGAMIPSLDEVNAHILRLDADIEAQRMAIQRLVHERDILKQAKNAVRLAWKSKMDAEDSRRPVVNELLGRTDQVLQQMDSGVYSGQWWLDLLKQIFQPGRYREQLRRIQSNIEALRKQSESAVGMSGDYLEDSRSIQRAIEDNEAQEARLTQDLERLDDQRSPLVRRKNAMDRLYSTLDAVRALASSSTTDMRALNERLDPVVREDVLDEDALLVSIEEWIDLNFRFQHFHMASRYWEGRWLDAPLDTRIFKDSSRTPLLRSYAMLAPVIVATVHSIFGINPNAYGYADLLIFDEAGQATPELGCATFALAKRAIVVGDVYQLEPIWNIVHADNFHLLRMSGLDGVPTAYDAATGSVMMVAQHCSAFGVPDGSKAGGVTLRAHYRCRNEIIGYCKTLIYGDDLIPSRLVKSDSDYLYGAMSWVRVPSSGAERINGSQANDAEVREIVAWLADDAEIIKAHYGKDDLADLVAIITPFRAQAQAIKKAIGERFGKVLADRMVINTVHALQGAEKPIVAFSLVQSIPPYFVDGYGTPKPNLLNVAVSRAQDAFVLFAHPDALALPKSGQHSPLDVLRRYLVQHGKRLYPRELVFIESGQKAVHIRAALGRRVHVLATSGHFKGIANWPKNSPPLWKTSGHGAAFLSDLDHALADAGQFDAFVLATDDDRDGEEIAWHILRALNERDPLLVSRTLRMRFHQLDRESIQQARKRALPGIDRQRVQAALLKRLVDARFIDTVRAHTGVPIGRSQIVALRHIAAASVKRHDQACVRVNGHVGDQPVSGYVVANAANTAPVLRMNDDQAHALASQLEGVASVSFDRKASALREYPRFAPNTTDRVMISAWRMYGWRPDKTARHLQDVYYGAYSLEVHTDDATHRNEGMDA